MAVANVKCCAHFIGALQLAGKSQAGGALKLLNELDSLSSLLGADLSQSDVTQSVKTTTTQSKTVKLSKVSSTFHGQPFEQAVKGNYLNTNTGVYTDYSGKMHTLSEAFERDLINPDSAVFINPRDSQSMTLHNAIQREIIDKTGHYSPSTMGSTLDLAECMAKSLVVAREVEPIVVDSEKKEEHYQFHVDKVRKNAAFTRITRFVAELWASLNFFSLPDYVMQW